ncbi:MAG TPA: FadD3 family acyl-CoA ligase [Acidimicrobiia bacterium]|nr:FadD3 family acyl-CoA ligase [Acidimicrobiia bacterium]
MTPADASGTTDLPLTIPGLVRRAAEVFGTQEGFVDGDVRLTFAELAAEIETAARALVGRGVEPGDRVAIWAPNCWEWAVTALACHSVGGVVIPLNTRFKGEEAAQLIRSAGARLLFTVTDFLDTDYVELLDRADAAGLVDETVILRGTVPKTCVSLAEHLANGERITAEQVRDRADAVMPDDLCDIVFTSGTTGAPKGAMLMHGPSIRAYDAWSSVVGLRADDRYLIVNPFFHCFGLKAGLLACLIKGSTIVPHPVFDVPAVMRRVVEERITMLPGAPAVFQTILNHPELASFDLSSLRLSVTGAATIPTQMIIDMREILGFETVVTGYGLTEAHGIATMCRHTDDPETIASTSGRPIPEVEIQIVDEQGAAVTVGESGEVLVRGYNLMAGYLDDPAATAEAIDVDGWLHTGDVGVLDERGNLRITDRMKNMFIVGGFNAYPAEIEQIMDRLPTVAQVAVVGIPDDRLGEVGMAFVVPTTGADVDAAEIIAWCREHMANYKVPRRVEIVEELVLNASGKVDVRAMQTAKRA